MKKLKLLVVKPSDDKKTIYKNLIKYLEEQKSRNELKTINGIRYIKDIEWHKTINKTLNYINRSVKQWKDKIKYILR